MGLDFSHCNAHWSYSGFNRFRSRLAAQIGIDLYKMQGFGGRQQRSWEGYSDPIVPFLNHSDCDSDLSPQECATVAPRLVEIVSGWPDDDYDKVMAMELVHGMDLCAARGEPLIFC